MTPAPWRTLLDRALGAGADPAARFLQLATVRPDGRPANRTLVFRGFLLGSDWLRFATDVRSAKVEQIAFRPWGEACWYFAATREQFRLAGPLDLVTADDPDQSRLDARREVWAALSDAARAQYAWPQPGADRAPDAAFAAPPGDPGEPLPSFGLLLLDPAEVDHLELAPDPHRRTRYRRGPDGDWDVRPVNP
jgi:PPOX class probable FMN-dependent enzyme